MENLKVTQAEVEAALNEPEVEDVDGLIGGFGPPVGPETPDGTEHPEMAAAEPAKKAASGSAAPAYRGLAKTFQTSEELATYTSELERKVIEAEAKLSVFDRNGAVPANAETKPAPAAKKSYAERFFVDPDGVIDELRTEILSEVETKTHAKQTEKQFWVSFYDENPDLRGAEELVDLKLNQNRASWDKTPLDQVRVLLATETRKYVARIREGAKPTETLASTRAHSLSPSSGSAPRMSGTQTGPKTFSEQILALRNKGKRVG